MRIRSGCVRGEPARRVLGQLDLRSATAVGGQLLDRRPREPSHLLPCPAANYHARQLPRIGLADDGHPRHPEERRGLLHRQHRHRPARANRWPSRQRRQQRRHDPSECLQKMAIDHVLDGLGRPRHRARHRASRMRAETSSTRTHTKLSPPPQHGAGTGQLGSDIRAGWQGSRDHGADRCCWHSSASPNLRTKPIVYWCAAYHYSRRKPPTCLVRDRATSQLPVRVYRSVGSDAHRIVAARKPSEATIWLVMRGREANLGGSRATPNCSICRTDPHSALA